MIRRPTHSHAVQKLRMDLLKTKIKTNLISVIECVEYDSIAACKKLVIRSVSFKQVQNLLSQSVLIFCVGTELDDGKGVGKWYTYFFSSIRMWVSGTVGNMELILATVASVSAALILLEKDVSCIALRPRPIRGVCGLDRTTGDSSCFGDGKRWWACL